MKAWNFRLVGLIGAALMAGLIALAVAGPVRLIRMPDGHWLRVRTPGVIKVAGGQYRYFMWGTDAVVRRELDTDGDGRYDVRGDDWQSSRPRWCWLRGASGWEPAAPERCVAASDQLLKGHP
ncbi:hypothetical protein [Pyxidicoccus caerfyrddinensis]|uniref:hypothetical protein n=1 Tax=Pyxidicoccus caerfyrddinensis TaxID=2709663 RepID=UPI0013DB3F60|nr:hypothetical protein [Pyxidicoccus caerfyrddinensis]